MLSIPPQLGLLPGSPQRYLDTVEVWRSSRHGPTTVFKFCTRIDVILTQGLVQASASRFWASPVTSGAISA